MVTVVSGQSTQALVTRPLVVASTTSEQDVVDIGKQTLAVGTLGDIVGGFEDSDSLNHLGNGLLGRRFRRRRRGRLIFPEI